MRGSVEVRDDVMTPVSVAGAQMSNRRKGSGSRRHGGSGSNDKQTGLSGFYRNFDPGAFQSQFTYRRTITKPFRPLILDPCSVNTLLTLPCAPVGPVFSTNAPRICSLCDFQAANSDSFLNEHMYSLSGTCYKNN